MHARLLRQRSCLLFNSLYTTIRSFYSSVPLCAGKYEGALHPDLVSLVQSHIDEQAVPPKAPAVALPHANLTILTQPTSGNKVFLLGTSGTAPALSARQAGALIQLTQPGLLALESLRGYDFCLVGVVDMRQPECPSNVSESLWETGASLLTHKAKVLSQRSDIETRLKEEWLPHAVQDRLQRLLTLLEHQLESPFLQDAVVDLERGTVDITQIARMAGTFDIPLPFKQPSDLLPGLLHLAEEAATFLRRLPFNLTGRGEPYERGAEFRVAIKEAPASARIVCLAPSQAATFAQQLERIWGGLQQLTPRQMRAVSERARQLLAAGEAAFPEGLDASLTGEIGTKEGQAHWANAKALEQLHPKEYEIFAWKGAYMADRLAFESAEAPGRPVTVAVATQVLVPFMLRRWLERFHGSAAQADAPEPAAEAAAEPQPVQASRRGRRKRRR